MKRFFMIGGAASAMIVVAGGLGAVTPAAAQDASSIKAIQRQIEQLQAELRKLQSDAAARDAALKQAQDDASQARAAAAAAQAKAALVLPPSAPPNSALVTIPPNDKDAAGKPVYNPNKPNGRFNIGGVTVTLGGFAELDGIYRSRNETRGTSSSFTGIPFNNTADGHLSELRGTAQQSRFSVLAQGNINNDILVSGYGEADFNNGAGNANSVQSSSYTPRLRQAYAQIDDTTYGLHVVGGQIWSLATPFKSGLNPRAEVVPMTIDSGYLPGVTYLRVPELRISKDFLGKYWIGLAADDPQTVIGGTPPTLAGESLVTVSTQTPGTGLNPTTTYSYSVAPDLILKAAADTPFGHYEAFGLARWFRDRSEFTTAATTTKDSTDTTMGGGVGASAYVPILPGLLEFSGNITYGDGIGRYGSGGLPDVTFKADGSLTPLREVMGTAGLIGHPTPAFDVYGYAGLDQIEKNTFSLAGKLGGYGPGIGSNTGCDIEDSGAFSTPLNCSANNKQLGELTAGFWWRFLQGSFGTLQAGAQYGFVERKTFDTTGGSKTAPENLVYGALRYTPFQ